MPESDLWEIIIHNAVKRFVITVTVSLSLRVNPWLLSVDDTPRDQPHSPKGRGRRFQILIMKMHPQQGNLQDFYTFARWLMEQGVKDKISRIFFSNFLY